MPVHQGLSNPFIQTFQEDKTGMIWMGTAQGLNRFDGQRYIHYNDAPNNPNRIPASFIHTIIPLTKDSLLIFAKQELFLLHTTTNEVTDLLTNSTTLKGHKVNDIFQAPDDCVWVLTYQNSSRYLSYWTPPNEWTVVDSMADVLIRWSQVRVEASGELWWIEPDGRLRCYDADKRMDRERNFSAHFLPVSNRRFGKMLVDDIRKGVWLLTYQQPDHGQLAFYNPDLDSLLYFEQPLPFFPNSAYQDHLGNCWFYRNAARGLFKLTPENEIIDYSERLLNTSPYNRIISMYEDEHQLMWVATDQCIFRFSNQKSPFQQLFTDLAFRPTSIFEQSGKIIAQSYAQNYLLQYNETTQQTTKTYLSTDADKPYRRPIAGREFVQQDSLAWGVVGPFSGAEKGGMASIDLVHQRLTIDSQVTPEYMGTEYVVAMVAKDGTIIYCWAPKDIFRYDPTRKAVERLLPKGTISSSFTHSKCLAESKDGTIWLGTFRNGLLRIRPHEKIEKHYTSRSTPAISNDYVNDVYEEPSGEVLWAVTYYGLNRIDLVTDSVEVFTTEQGLSSNLIYNILPYGDHHLVLSTDFGLSIFDKRTQSFYNYYAGDGLSSNHFVLGTPLISEAGKYYFPTQNGITAFFPEELLQQDVNIPFRLSRFAYYDEKSREVIEKEIELGGIYEFTLPPRTEYFQAEFALLSYHFSDQNRYKSRLEGAETDWRQLNNNGYVRYNQLSAGDYTLRIQAANANGHWNAKELQLKIHVEQVFYKTWWFILLCVLTGIAIVVTALQFWVRQKLKVVQIRSQISSDLHDEIGTSLAHLSMVMNAVEVNADSTSQTYFQKSTLIVQSVISKIRDVVWAIDAQNDESIHLIDRMEDFAYDMLTARDIQYTFQHNLPKNLLLRPLLRQNCYLIYKEAITNIIRHSNATQVNISLTKQKNQLALSVQDNGKQNITSPKSSGSGLKNMQLRAERIRGTVASHHTENGFEVCLIVSV